jgi:hypothetical protein
LVSIQQWRLTVICGTRTDEFSCKKGNFMVGLH